jgi:DNA-binding GntR family transcriptional regulator
MASRSRIASTPDLTELVYQRLLYAICDGELVLGTRLMQEELAAMLGLSRQPVLQALRLLKKEGFVSDAGRSGWHESTVCVPATISPPSSPATCMHPINF